MKTKKIKLKMRDGMQDETISLFIFWEFIFRPKIPPFLVYSGALPAVSVPFFRHYMPPFSSSERSLSGPICRFFPPLAFHFPTFTRHSLPKFPPLFSGSTCRPFPAVRVVFSGPVCRVFRPLLSIFYYLPFRHSFTMVENVKKKHRQNSHLIIHCPTSEGVSEVSERANE